MIEIVDTLVKQLIPQGVFALLFFFLLLYVLSENGKREGKYQEIIQNLTETLKKDINCLCEDVKEIKSKIFK